MLMFISNIENFIKMKSKNKTIFAFLLVFTLIFSFGLTSAYGDTENYQKAKEIGAKEFFTKPIDFKNLREELHDVLEDNE